MRQDWGRSRRERSARQVVQRWEELPGVPAFYSSRLVEVTVSVCPCSCQLCLSPHTNWGDLIPFRKCLGGISLGKLGPFL
jgi:hypothetical protein